MNNHISLVNTTKDNSEVDRIQDAKEEDLYCLDNIRFAYSDNKGGLVSNHSSLSLAIIILLFPKEFFEIEGFYTISQGGCKICNEVLQFQLPKFHLPQP